MIRITFTHKQDEALAMDSWEGVSFVRSGKATVVYEASAETWAKELQFAGGMATQGGDWTPGYSRSAGSVAGRIAKALNRHNTKEG